ncbi:VOC family protein [Lacinutrix sp. Hel_I_90]|uniref:VOC family protein n=1 Tax=Lacinutrix sp. Hel_I_90 TaxID=1249999 RepID=UPI0005CA7F7D|nr:VOC family protein [Lacinutrix sp. Hel_I_90]
MDSLSPNIFVKDISETVNFYKTIGFQVVMTVPEESEFVWVMMTCGKVSFMFQSFQSLGSELPEISRQNGGSLLLYIQIKHIKQFHDKIKGKVNVIKGLEKTFYGATEFSILDLNGYVLTFAEHEN